MLYLNRTIRAVLSLLVILSVQVAGFASVVPCESFAANRNHDCCHQVNQVQRSCCQSCCSSKQPTISSLQCHCSQQFPPANPPMEEVLIDKSDITEDIASTSVNLKSVKRSEIAFYQLGIPTAAMSHGSLSLQICRWLT